MTAQYRCPNTGSHSRPWDCDKLRTDQHDHTPANRKPATPAIRLSAELVEAPSEALANEAAAAEFIAPNVEAPTDEVADAIAEHEAETKSTRKEPAVTVVFSFTKGTIDSFRSSPTAKLT